MTAEKKLQLKQTAFVDFALEPIAAYVVRLTRHTVGKHGNHSYAAERKDRHDLIVVSGIDVDIKEHLKEKEEEKNEESQREPDDI